MLAIFMLSYLSMRTYFLRVSFLLKFISCLSSFLGPYRFLVLKSFFPLIKTSCSKEAFSDSEAIEGREMDSGPRALLSCLQLTGMQINKSPWRRGLCSHEGPPCARLALGYSFPGWVLWRAKLWRAKPALTSCATSINFSFAWSLAFTYITNQCFGLFCREINLPGQADY